ncbi:hypothetical protein J6590_007899 [Homalodisca vitripennis]|nr:hypothetical protein J6590_007899 [Homalodisca vitripennis]
MQRRLAAYRSNGGYILMIAAHYRLVLDLNCSGTVPGDNVLLTAEDGLLQSVQSQIGTIKLIRAHSTTPAKPPRPYGAVCQLVVLLAPLHCTRRFKSQYKNMKETGFSGQKPIKTPFGDLQSDLILSSFPNLVSSIHINVVVYNEHRKTSEVYPEGEERDIWISVLTCVMDSHVSCKRHVVSLTPS